MLSVLQREGVVLVLKNNFTYKTSHRRAPSPALWNALKSACLAPWYSTAACLASWRVQRLYRACLQSREGRPRSSFPVVAFTTSKLWSPTVQFTLKLGAFPGCRASALLIPVTVDVEHMS
ncbi:hypothetical protein EYF80_050517 [Liparis tanakae]|uniref:Uncharacterized protein n=1 Tax=Liparis tanakae TaxID=230148 RepID=A0A4Z2FFY5_9TELE|nr:hypothetical protein EYF80_050517 [Liparis tanakae]